MHLRKSFYVLISLLVIVGMTAPAPVAAGKTGNLIFIFDASGSMWGQIGGKNKIVIAKEAMDKVVMALPDGLNVGLVAYGHRRKGDCDDVETLIPLGKLDKASLLAKVKAINPKGKTPMVRSIRKTADAIKHLEDETTILLISDGEETCDPNPCSFVAELKALGINFVLHVVGFDVVKKIEDQLKCMASKGGGEYFPAKDAGKLKKALDTVIKKTVAQNLVVTAFDGNQKPLSARVWVVNAAGKVVDSDAGKRVGFGLAPGTYAIRVKPEAMSETQVIKDVVVTEDQVTHRKVVFSKSKITVSMQDASGKSIKGYVRIIEMNTNQMAEAGDHTGDSTSFIVSPGDYLVDMECSNTGKRIKSERFTLTPGEDRQVNGICANASIGVLVRGAGGQPITGYVRLVDVPNRTNADEADSRPSMRYFKVPPGTYKIDVECPGGKRVRGDVFQMQAGQKVEVEVNCQSGTVQSSGIAGQASVVQGGVSSKTIAAGGSMAGGAVTGDISKTDAQIVAARQMLQSRGQIEADAMAQAQQAEASGMAQMQAAMANLKKSGIGRADMSGRLPTVPDDNSGNPPVAGVQPGVQVGVPSGMRTGAQIDESKIGARDTGGGLDDMERPEQGRNPYSGMTNEQARAAFAKDVGMQGPQGIAYDRNKWQLSANGWPLQCIRYEDTMKRRLKTYKRQAESMGRSDIIARIKVARTNLKKLAKQRKKRYRVDVVQQTLDKCVQEVHAINVSVAQGQ